MWLVHEHKTFVFLLIQIGVNLLKSQRLMLWLYELARGGPCKYDWASDEVQHDWCLLCAWTICISIGPTKNPDNSWLSSISGVATWLKKTMNNYSTFAKSALGRFKCSLFWFQNLILAEIFRAQGYLASEYHFVHATKNHDSKKGFKAEGSAVSTWNQKTPKTVQTVIRSWQ